MTTSQPQLQKINETLITLQKIGEAMESLSPRQLEIARLISQDKTDKEIARELKIKVGTVKTIAGMARLKIGVKGRVGLAVWYILKFGY